MYLDASAIVAILADEQEASYMLAKLENATKPVFCSSLTVFEAVISLARIAANRQLGKDAPVPAEFINEAQQDVAELLSILKVREIAISGQTHRSALDAARIYGKVVAHPARLNFGDCFVYACAKENRLPILFIGHDFSKTDIEIA